jgi:hypothetical protein
VSGALPEPRADVSPLRIDTLFPVRDNKRRRRRRRRRRKGGRARSRIRRGPSRLRRQ